MKLECALTKWEGVSEGTEKSAFQPLLSGRFPLYVSVLSPYLNLRFRLNLDCHFGEGSRR